MASDELRDAVREHEWRLRALDSWRERTDKRLVKCEDGVKDLQTAEMIADEVAARIGKRDQLRLSKRQKVMASSLALLAIVPSLADVLSRAFH